jgi:hypothetical protein
MANQNGLSMADIMAALKADPKLWEQLKSNDLDEELSRNLPTYIATGKNGAGAVMPIQFLTMANVKGQAVRLCKLGAKINRDGTPFVAKKRSKPQGAVSKSRK